MSSLVSALDTALSRVADLADNPSIDYKQLVVVSSWAVAAFEVWLFRRQIACYSLPSPPPELASHLPSETFTKAQSYGRDKTRFSLIKAIYSQLLGWGLIRFGVYASTWAISGRAMGALGLDEGRVITRSLLWITLLTFLTTLPSLPWSYYHTFLKTWLLMAVIGMPILATFLKIIELAGKSFVPWLMLFMIVVQLTLQLIYPTFIQPLFNKLAPLPSGELRERVEKLAGRLGFPLKHLYVIDGSKRSSHSNAYFYGLPWSKHIVIYDTLMEKSSPAEVEAVLAHELGHWYFSHPTKLLLIAQFHLLFTFTLFHIFIHNRSLFSSFDFPSSLAVAGPNGSPSSQPIIIGFMLFQMVLEPLDTVVKFLMNKQTRKYEYQADEFAVRLDKTQELKDALIKLHVDNLSSPHNDPIYSAYHHSHPTLPERLRAMDEFKPGPGLKLKGEKKEL
ncbi:hypothetical protein EHS25_001456 [Saitozyma podzolica]|uniref:CAAX prenyl protease n=1 Tax=Saitozyma podzolica TaxID=1890683 RepID=A0A427YGH9_9TREE|nr:hypothetical protein EHS25_001456 [Saitozyma podzolica]